jgi:ERCC4-type nuclease
MYKNTKKVNKPFLDIFLPKQNHKNKKPKTKIIIDYREKNCLVASNLIRLGLEIEFKELKVADYIIHNIAIERKTIPDFKSSMLNKRLFSQLEELKQYPNKLLVIEGIEEQELYNDDHTEGINANAIRGFLLSILLKHKIPLIFTKNQEDTARFISILSKKKNKEPPLNITKKSLDKKEQLQFIIESFPGIGPKSAKKLLQEFKTIKNIINAEQNELQKILGKKAKIIKELTEIKYT